MTRERLNAFRWLKGDIIRRGSATKVELLDDGTYQSGGGWGLWSFQARVIGTENVITVIPMVTDENLTMAEEDKNNLTCRFRKCKIPCSQTKT